MARSILTKCDLLVRLYKFKHELYNGRYHNKGKDWNEGAHFALNKILDTIDEYSN